jgi:hypothetical protein
MNEVLPNGAPSVITLFLLFSLTASVPTLNTLLHRPKLPPEVRDDSQLLSSNQASGRFLEKSHQRLDSLVDELDNASPATERVNPI